MEYYENPKRNIRSAGLLIKRRSTPQSMFGGDGGERDSVRLFKLCLFKRPDSMKDNEALYLTIINRPNSADEWPTRTRMGENTIGSIVKSMTSCLNTNKKLINHYMKTTFVSKRKKSGQAQNVITYVKSLAIHTNHPLMTTMKRTKIRDTRVK